MGPEPTRPWMPGYGVESATSAPGERVPWQRVQTVLSAARNYWLASVRPDGRPHAAPVWGAWFDDRLWFATARDSRKGRNIAQRPHVVVCAEDDEVAVVLEGRAAEVDDHASIRRFAEDTERKYDWRPDPPGLEGWLTFLSESNSALYAVRPRAVFSFAENLAETATR